MYCRFDCKCKKYAVLSFFFHSSSSLGDNMLTALSVAQDCGMIESSSKVILVTIIPVIGKQETPIQRVYAEDTSKNVKEVTLDEHVSKVTVKPS